MKKIRLDKYLADAGAGTRSEVKKYISKAQVQVNGKTVLNPAEKIEPEEVEVCCRGQVVHVDRYEYYLLHKPAGCVSATEDVRERTVMEFVPSRRKDLFPVGRLDKDTEGLLLITNDGELAHRLLAPRRHVPKQYFAQIKGKMTQEDAQKFRQGVEIGEKNPTLPAKLEILSVENGEEGWISCINLTIEEGKFHQIKRMVQAVGKEVIYLKRISMGPLYLDENLERGQCRPLTEKEIELLKKAATKS